MGNQISGENLLKAATDGRMNDVMLLIEHGVDPNYANFLNQTALFLAALSGHKEIVSLLIARGADVNQSKLDGWTPLSIAAYKGHKEIVLLLISLGANVNQAQDFGRTPLFAAVAGQKEIVSILILNGANVNQVDFNGDSPLFIAAAEGQEEIVSFLLSNGAHVNQTNYDGKNPLYFAAQCGHNEVVSLLIASGANVHQTTSDGKTPLFIASEWGHVDSIQLLLQAKAEFDIKTKDGLTPLKIATQNNHKEAARLLKELFIIQAVQSGDVSKLKLLVVDLENAHITDKNGNTLVHIAIENNHPLVLDILLELPNIQLDAYNHKKETPFTLAMKLRNHQIIKMIVAALTKKMHHIDIKDLEYDSSQFLGKGAFGAVYKGMYMKEIVAIKKITKQAENSVEFEREIISMQQCRSPFLLHLIGVAELNTNEPKLVLEFMDGGDLRNHLDKKRTKQATVTNYSTLEIAWAIANGLADIHHNKCVHRDIKSLNVLLSTKHYIKLAEMGLTRDVASTMTQGAGTLYWTAPEVLRDGGRYGTSADIYSFGVLLTELDTLLLPYCYLKLTPFVILNRICDGTLRPTLSRKCPSWYKELVDRCLSNDPRQRPTAPEIVCIIEMHFLEEKSENLGEIKLETMESSLHSIQPTFGGTAASIPNPRVIPLPLAATDINCPSCKLPNLLSNDTCTNCSKVLMEDSIKINILVQRLTNLSLATFFVCSVCHFVNDITSTHCTTCREELMDSDKVCQLVARLTKSS